MTDDWTKEAVAKRAADDKAAWSAEQARRARRARKNPIAAFMVAYPLDPGHSDLDDEQPMVIGGDRCTLGDVREAKRRAYALVRDLRELDPDVLPTTTREIGHQAADLLFALIAKTRT